MKKLLIVCGFLVGFYSVGIFANAAYVFVKSGYYGQNGNFAIASHVNVSCNDGFSKKSPLEKRMDINKSSKDNYPVACTLTIMSDTTALASININLAKPEDPTIAGFSELVIGKTVGNVGYGELRQPHIIEKPDNGGKYYSPAYITLIATHVSDK